MLPPIAEKTTHHRRHRSDRDGYSRPTRNNNSMGYRRFRKGFPSLRSTIVLVKVLVMIAGIAILLLLFVSWWRFGSESGFRGYGEIGDVSGITLLRHDPQNANGVADDAIVLAAIVFTVPEDF